MAKPVLRKTISVRLWDLSNVFSLETNSDKDKAILHANEFGAESTLETSNRPDIDKILFAPYSYFVRKSGTRWTVLMVDCFNRWAKIPENKLMLIREMAEMIRVALLMLDDIEDNDVSRDHGPVTNLLFGNAHCINTANFVTVVGALKAKRLNHPKALRIYLNLSKLIGLGQHLDIVYILRDECPSEEDYMAMIERKTVPYFSGSVAVMEQFSTERFPNLALIQKISIFYQLCNDYSNLFSEKYRAEKGFCTDITEGKFGLLFIRALKMASKADSKRIFDILKLHTNDRSLKEECRNLIVKSGAKDEVWRRMNDLLREITDEIHSFGGNEILEKAVNALLP